MSRWVSRQALWQWLWERDLHALPSYQAVLLSALRISMAVLRDLLNGQLGLRASSLSYTTLLSLVPLLALSFSLLKAMGVHNQLEPLLMQFLAPLGDKGMELGRQLIQMVDKVGVKVLGAVGLVLLLYTVVSLIQKVEAAFNLTWRVSRLRPWSQRISGYLSIVLLGPLLMFSAMGMTAAVMDSRLMQALLSLEPFGSLYYLLSQILPYFLVMGAFVASYMLIPNTRVKLRSALVGGLVGAVLWLEVGQLFASFVVGSTKYTAIYSSFAIVILFLMWLHISWLILLLGSAVAFYCQHPACQRYGHVRLGQAERELLALEVMRRAVLGHFNPEERCTREGLAESLQLPLDLLNDVTDPLHRHGLLELSDDEPGFYLPGRDPSVISVAEVLTAVQGDARLARRVVKDAIVWDVHGHVQAILQRQLGERSLEQVFAEEIAPACRVGEDGGSPASEREKG